MFVREKIRHARLVGNKNGIKLSQHEQNAPNWGILGVLGEFCTGTGGVRGVLGEFCTGTGTVWGVQGEFCTGTGGVRGVLGEFCTGTAGPSSRGESVAPIVLPHSVDGGCEVGITKPLGARPGGGGAGDGNRTRL